MCADFARRIPIAMAVNAATLLAAGALLAPTGVQAAPTGAPVLMAQARQPQRTAPAESLEMRFWTAIQNSRDASDFQTYLDAYPQGQFAAQARARLTELQRSAKPPAPGGLVIQPVTPAATPPAPPARPTNPAGAASLRDCDQCPVLLLIPAGKFAMGSTEFFPFEGPVHQVTIGQPFYMAQRETTYEEWDACVREGGCSYTPNDRGQGRGARPVTNVHWNDAKQFTAWLSRKTGRTYRLPSEAEWEYAARGGATTNYYWGRNMEKGKANCSGCDGSSGKQAVATGSFPPNAYGLYDMAGNAAEWVEDCWEDSYRGAPANGSARTEQQCQERVLRGGSFNNDPRYLRTASRFKYDFDVRYYTNGFRVLREAP